MNHEEVEKSLHNCLEELDLVRRGECDAFRAEKNAAYFLQVQIHLAKYLADAESKAKSVKSEVERLSSQKYFEYKADKTGPKMTEAALEHAIVRDEEVFKLKSEMIKAEAEHKKWNYIFNILSNGHLTLRSIARKE